MLTGITRFTHKSGSAFRVDHLPVLKLNLCEDTLNNDKSLVLRDCQMQAFDYLVEKTGTVFDNLP